MRRSPLLAISVYCPHFDRQVAAKRNEMTEQLVDCASKEDCRTVAAGTTVVVYPRGCPVFRTASFTADPGR
jgi:hypothetical protein